MIEVHDPVRLLMIVEHFPDVVLQTIQKNPATYEWFINEWVNLAAINPETQEISVFKNGEFVPYNPLVSHVDTVNNMTSLLETHHENLPVYSLS